MSRHAYCQQCVHPGGQPHIFRIPPLWRARRKAMYFRTNRLCHLLGGGQPNTEISMNCIECQCREQCDLSLVKLRFDCGSAVKDLWRQSLNVGQAVSLLR